jgi:competence protein ComEA
LPPLSTLMLQPPANTAGTPAPYATKINLNRASLEQIQSLPGVGPGLGAHILAGRPYRTLADLARDGVPFPTLEKIAPLITLGP